MRFEEMNRRAVAGLSPYACLSPWETREQQFPSTHSRRLSVNPSLTMIGRRLKKAHAVNGCGVEGF
jgi:hypothetical protein